MSGSWLINWQLLLTMCVCKYCCKERYIIILIYFFKKKQAKKSNLLKICCNAKMSTFTIVSISMLLSSVEDGWFSSWPGGSQVY